MTFQAWIGLVFTLAGFLFAGWRMTVDVTLKIGAFVHRVETAASTIEAASSKLAKVDVHDVQIETLQRDVEQDREALKALSARYGSMAPRVAVAEANIRHISQVDSKEREPQ